VASYGHRHTHTHTHTHTSQRPVSISYRQRGTRTGGTASSCASTAPRCVPPRGTASCGNNTQTSTRSPRKRRFVWRSSESRASEQPVSMPLPCVFVVRLHSTSHCERACVQACMPTPPAPPPPAVSSNRLPSVLYGKRHSFSWWAAKVRVYLRNFSLVRVDSPRRPTAAAIRTAAIATTTTTTTAFCVISILVARARSKTHRTSHAAHSAYRNTICVSVCVCVCVCVYAWHDTMLTCTTTVCCAVQWMLQYEAEMLPLFKLPAFSRRVVTAHGDLHLDNVLIRSVSRSVGRSVGRSREIARGHLRPIHISSSMWSSLFTFVVVAQGADLWSDSCPHRFGRSFISRDTSMFCFW